MKYYCYYISMNLPHLSHHSHYLIGSTELRNDLKEFLKKVHNIVISGNPDFFESHYETFTIDDSRALKEIHGIRPVHESGKKIFIVSMNGITVEAQNALLKFLEEPAQYAYFFLILPSAHILLPTVKSRMVRIETDHEEKSDSTIEGEKFLKMSKAKRLEVIKDLIDDISKEKKTKQDAIYFLDEVELAIYKKGEVKDSVSILETLAMARKYIHDRAPSLKMLLESVAMGI